MPASGAAAAADENSVFDAPTKAGSARGMGIDHLEDISTTCSKGLPGCQLTDRQTFF
jgi:hypothetical protein